MEGDMCEVWREVRDRKNGRTMWLLQELPVQRTMIVGFSSILLSLIGKK